ncbi:MAG: DNA alkylation repair protein, partial [Erysipelotrichaceae bacterium]|nr:DNA alkylation repair protein [Erysipelotrichaceae bacterium]
QGFVIGYSKMPMADRIPYINDYINKSDSWNLIDSFVSTVKPKVREREVLWNYLDYIKYSDRPFTVRFVLVMMLNSYLDDEHIDEVLRYTESIQSDHYYVTMAQAWLLATAYINYDDKVNEILERGKLNKFTHNKTIQKAIESYRISDEDKERLRRMRK